MERETFEVLEKDIRDFTSRSGWTIKGKRYNFIEQNRTNGDGEWFDVITQRESDNKYFKFSWGRSESDYYYEPQWTEVFLKIITKTIFE